MRLTILGNFTCRNRSTTWNLEMRLVRNTIDSMLVSNAASSVKHLIFKSEFNTCFIQSDLNISVSCDVHVAACVDHGWSWLYCARHEN